MWEVIYPVVTSWSDCLYHEIVLLAAAFPLELLWFPHAANPGFSAPARLWEQYLLDKFPYLS